MTTVTGLATGSAEPLIDVPDGLRGVAVTDTRLGDVRGAEGFFHYRQYSATDLARSRSLEDVWRLLLDGDLPATAAERERFAAEVGALRVVPREVADLLPGIARHGGAGLAGLRTALSLLAQADGMPPLWDTPPERRRRDLVRLAAATPTLVAALWRHASGLDPVPPDPGLGHVADYLRMLGVPAGAEEEHGGRAARAVEQYAMLTVDHGFNASTFTARVVASTGADPGAAVVAALGALSGPLHGGAPSRALELLEAIGEPSRAAAWVRGALERNERIMGFGHAVYRTSDPRSELLREIAQGLGGDLVDFAVAVEAIITDTLAELRPGRHLYANVEYYAGVVMATCGLDPRLFTPTFAVGRTIRWTANIAEQAASRRIIRPAARYVGPPPPQPVPALEG